MERPNWKPYFPFEEKRSIGNAVLADNPVLTDREIVEVQEAAWERQFYFGDVLDVDTDPDDSDW